MDTECGIDEIESTFQLGSRSYATFLIIHKTLKNRGRMDEYSMRIEKCNYQKFHENKT